MRQRSTKRGTVSRSQSTTFPSDEPIEDGLASVQDAAGGVQTAVQEMADGLGCNVES